MSEESVLIEGKEYAKGAVLRDNKEKFQVFVPTDTKDFILKIYKVIEDDQEQYEPIDEEKYDELIKKYFGDDLIE